LLLTFIFLFLIMQFMFLSTCEAFQSLFNFGAHMFFLCAKLLWVVIIFTFHNATIASGFSCMIFASHFIDSRFDLIRFQHSKIEPSSLKF
jgi:hypothetical protein